MSDCLFCKIIGGQIPGQFVDQDDQLVVIKDINPQSPLHVLIIPRKHIATINDLAADDDALIGAMHRAAARIAKDHGYSDRGYRTVFNINREAGQTVFHIHLHLLAGRTLTWPPG
jgi:histidine triad (HIT) family protein